MGAARSCICMYVQRCGGQCLSAEIYCTFRVASGGTLKENFSGDYTISRARTRAALKRCFLQRSLDTMVTQSRP